MSGAERGRELKVRKTIHTGGRVAERGFTLLEVMIGLALLLVGILAIIAYFPYMLRSAEAAELRTIGSGLALMKLEEIRRDNDDNGRLLNAIKSLPGPTDPVTFPMEPRLAYRFSSTTILYKHHDAAGNLIDEPTDPRDNPGVARVIIQISPEFRPGKEFILDEYRFDE